MPSTFFGLNIAYTGLQAASVSINTTAHNVSNVNTKGYSRQQTDVSADNALRTYAKYGTAGSGVIVNSIQQVRDSYYDVKYRSNETNYGYYNTMQTYMTQLEDYLNEYTLEGFTKAYADFFQSAIQLQEQPAEESVRNQFINKAQSLADYFNTLSSNLKNVQKDTNEEIGNRVDKINTISTSIASLNKQINQIEANHGTANDLRDARNNLLDELSQIVNIETTETPLKCRILFVSSSETAHSFVPLLYYKKGQIPVLSICPFSVCLTQTLINKIRQELSRYTFLNLSALTCSLS